MSATKILAQSTPALLCAFPGWKQPTLCRLIADIGGSGAPTARAGSTTPGVSIVRDTTGQYTVSFPACRDIAGISVNLHSTAPETADGASYATVDSDATETLATLGQFKFHTRRANDGNNEDPPSGDDMDITFWLDLG